MKEYFPAVAVQVWEWPSGNVLQDMGLGLGLRRAGLGLEQVRSGELVWDMGCDGLG